MPLWGDHDFALLARLLLSALLGGVIGLEREIHGRPAGFRTHLLVSLGSCLFVITSIEFYRIYGNFSGTVPVGVDPGRVAAQVVTGIGFLGAGAIIRDKASIRGLTTAACLWVAAALGVACGIALYGLAVFVTVVALFNLLVLKSVEKRLSRDTYLTVKLWGQDGGSFPKHVEEVLGGLGLTPLNVRFDRQVSQERLFMEFQVKCTSRDTSKDVLERLGTLPGMQRVRLE